jgi:putative ABC transport system ATP-binding protein
LLKFLNGVITPTSGVVRYNGTSVAELAPIGLRREVLLVSQSVYLFAGTVRDNFAEYYSYLELPPPCDETIREYLNLCCADDLPIDGDTSVFSGGERQRVFLAVNLSLPAKVIMLDEPTCALDSKTADTVTANIKKHCKQNDKHIIAVSHDKAIVDKFADEVITL